MSACTLVGLASPAHAAVLEYEKGVDWISNRDLTSQQFSEKFNQYRSQGYMMVDVDAYPMGRGTGYSMVWRKNTDGRGWAEYRDMTSDQYHQRWTEMRDRGYRPLDVESYRVRRQQRYAGIWVENREGYSWSSRRGMTSSQYSTYFNEQRDRDRRPIDIEAYETGDGIRYAAIWVSNPDGVDWVQLRNLTRNAYQSEVNKRQSQGYSLVDFESYTAGRGQQRYAAIWEKRPGFAQQVRTNRSATGFANLWRQYRDEGYRLVDFERYNTPEGTRYGGVWLENAARYRYSRKGELDNIVQTYHSTNGLPGISVAIVEDGQMIYRRGFGWADVENQKAAHGETIYNAASVSKVIGGTLAVKLQDEGRLSNGRRVNLDLSRSTRSYLTNVRLNNGTRVSLPASHRHTLEQLFAHLGCVQHYSGPEPASGHYDWSIDAVAQIWNAPFVNNCTVGTNRSYSTHAFTYLSAAMEQATGQTSAQLVASELADPLNLSTLRVAWDDRTLPANYDRAVPYNDSGNRSSYDDNSWKPYGGGIESSPVDLAWFGWNLLDGNVVDAAARDDVLWTRVIPNSLGAIAWEIPGTSSVGGYRVAEHGGSWSGARSHLRVYRDEGLVIAVMSNRRGHTVGDVDDLTGDLASVVLR